MTDNTWNILISICYPVMGAVFFAWWLQLAIIIVRSEGWWTRLKPITFKWRKLTLIRWEIPGRKVVAFFLLMCWTNCFDILRLRVSPSETEFLWHNSASNIFVFFGRFLWALSALWMFNQWRRGDLVTTNPPKVEGDTAPLVSPETPD